MNNTSHPGFLIPYTVLMMTVLDVIIICVSMLISYLAAANFTIPYNFPILGRVLILGAGLIAIGMATAIYSPFSDSRKFMFLAICLNVIGSIPAGSVSGILLYRGI